MKFITTALIALLCLTTSIKADALKWQTISVNDGKLSLEMPGQPTESTSTKSTIVGDVTSQLYTVQVPADGSVTVDCSDLPGTALFFAGADTIYSNAKGKFLSKVYGKADSWTSITSDGNQGMKLTFRTAPMNGKPGYDGEAHFYLVGDYLYVIAVMDEVGDDLEMQKKVFPSLKFTGS